jgi:hypothetical protein
VTPTPTPDALKSSPSNADEAKAGLEAVLGLAAAGECPQSLQTRWGVTCASGDLDGDGKPDAAYLVPLTVATSAAPDPAVVFVRRALDGKFGTFTLDAEPDASSAGRKFFAVEDRGLDKAPELAFLTNGCSSTACSMRAHIETWDGTSWRDIGPNDSGVVNLTAVSFSGNGAASVLTTQGGLVNAPGAGPTRSTTTVYKFDGTRYTAASQTSEKPVYLFHAILDADGKFDKGDFTGASQGYQEAITNKALKDWKKETDNTDGRSTLVSYALLRIAIATAGSGGDPNPSLDAVVTNATDKLFAFAADEFRRGFRDVGSVHAGCALVTTYLQTKTDTADIPQYIHDAFFYGYANPQKTFRDICPL